MHKCGNWDWGRTIPFLGIFVSNIWYCVFAVNKDFFYTRPKLTVHKCLTDSGNIIIASFLWCWHTVCKTLTAAKIIYAFNLMHDLKTSKSNNKLYVCPATIKSAVYNMPWALIPYSSKTYVISYGILIHIQNSLLWVSFDKQS
jgi:hypothetical protein